MTDKEIIVALRLCLDKYGDCRKCQFANADRCVAHLAAAAVNLIERLTAENADLRKELEWKDMVIALAQRKQVEAEAERDALREKKRWIAVTEKTPEYDMPQLALNADGDALIANYAYGEWFDTWGARRGCHPLDAAAGSAGGRRSVMERLTQRIKTGEVLMASEHEEKYTTEEWICMLQDRVADYEDSGVTPERVVWMKEVIEIAFDHDKSRAERAHELHVADKEGRVVVLPCKVGDTVYTVNLHKEIVDLTVDCFGIDETGELWIFTEDHNKTYVDAFEIRDIDDDVFLTREEAERALQELEGK